MKSFYDVYYAAPFFNSSERDLNERIISVLEANGLRVFYPLRDGIVAKEEMGGCSSWKEVAARVWECDSEAIINSRAMLAVIDGRSIDEGVCVEIGFAAAMKKPIVAFNSDDRKQFVWGHNPMVFHPIISIFSDPNNAGDEMQRILRCN